MSCRNTKSASRWDNGATVVANEYEKKLIHLLSAGCFSLGEYPDDFWADKEEERSILAHLSKQGYIEGNYTTPAGRAYLGELRAPRKTWLKRNWFRIASLSVVALSALVHIFVGLFL